MPMKGMCADCRHSGVIHQFGASQLVCREKPPVILPLPSPQGVQLTSCFPVVERTWVCGKYEGELQ